MSDNKKIGLNAFKFLYWLNAKTMNVNASRNCEQGNVGDTILTDFRFGLKKRLFFSIGS